MYMRTQHLIPVGLAVMLMGAAAAENASLIEAARAGDRAAVKTFVQKGANVNAAEGDGTTALHWASYRDDVEAADVLLKAGAKVNAANDLGATALWTASLNGSSTMVRRLLQAGADPNLALLAGETPVMVAARSGAVDVVEQLIAKGANVNARGTRDQTALMWAVAQQHPDVVKVLLAHRADIHAKSAVWSQVMAVTPHGFADYNKNIPHGGETALMFAARVGDLPSAQLLVGAGANVNDADAWGVSATTLAAHSGFTELVEFLLSKGADASADVAGFSALHCAIMRRDEKMAAALLDHGANPNAPLRTWTPTRRSSADFNFEPPLVGSTPFWLAARFTQPAVMRMLLKRGADPKFVHRSTYWAGEPATERQQITTVVMAAAGMGGAAPWVQASRAEQDALALEAIKIAVEHGVDVNAANTDGRTALDQAKAARLDKVVKFLSDNGATAGKVIEGKPSTLGRPIGPRF